MTLRARRWQPGRPPQPQAPRRRSSRLPWWAIIALVTLAAWQYAQWKKPSAPVEGEPVAGEARAVDGDSLEIGNVRVRLFGIDAPEGRQLCKDAAGEDYTCGVDARAALAKLIAGRTVSCTPADAASYDRLVAVCTVSSRENGKASGKVNDKAKTQQDLSEAMIRAGHAIELKSRSKGRYAAAEREAREAQRGLWAGSFERPSEWRQRTGR